jgi:proprotein convertase subtilisin/kexin type 5
VAERCPPISTYQEVNTKNCRDCDKYCNECFGPNSNQCTSCKTDYFLDGTTCSLSCPLNKYKDSRSNTCTNCDSFCLTCTGPSNNDCKECQRGFFLSGTVCEASCLEQYYQNSAEDYCCDPCFEGCAKCSGPNSNQCDSCIDGYFFYKNSKTCVKVCPDGTYKNLNLHHCSPCDNACKVCSGSSSSECSACNIPFNYLQSQSTCLIDCPRDTLAFSYICEACSPECASCTAAANQQACSSCKKNYYLKVASCVGPSECGTGFFPLNDEVNPICKACHGNCKECFGPSNMECNSCSDKFYFYEKCCEATCPTENYYADSANFICKNCHTTCLICLSGSENQCQKCKTGYFLQGTSCKTSCSDGFFASEGVCKDCDKICKICKDNAAFCTACFSPQVAFNGACKDSCDQGYYSANGACLHCPENCISCLAVNTCNACSGELLLKDNNSCYVECPEGYFHGEGTKNCYKCKENCALCKDETSCSKCFDPFFLYEKICVASCPEGYLPKENIMKICLRDCHYTCADHQCEGVLNRECTSCSANRVFTPSFSELSIGSCICPTSYFSQDGNATCISKPLKNYYRYYLLNI